MNSEEQPNSNVISGLWCHPSEAWSHRRPVSIVAAALAPRCPWRARRSHHQRHPHPLGRRSARRPTPPSKEQVEELTEDAFLLCSFKLPLQYARKVLNAARAFKTIKESRAG